MRFLLILILLAIVLGPIGVIAGLSVGAVILVILVPIAVLGFLARVLSRGGRTIGSALPSAPLPGAVDYVRQEPDGWYAVVDGARFGPWTDRTMAQAVLDVEQRKAGHE